MGGGGERFRRVDRLRSSKDFRRISREGRRFASESFILLAAIRAGKSRDASAQLGITVSQRVGHAVVRNRIKRLVREWFRRDRRRFPLGSEVVVIARPSARDRTCRELEQELGGLVDALAARQDP